jgi:hypothetical protein
MKQSTAATLSTHLLTEASKFLFYPNRNYRTKKNLVVQQALDNGLRRLVEWRKTFAPRTPDAATEMLNAGTLLDELYSRELLREVPEIVERTRSLANLTLSGVSGESLVYLREAANCYILGLPQAAVALARAAVEVPLRKAASKQFGEKAVAGLGLFALLSDLAVRGRLLSGGNLDLAHQIRLGADRVLHEQPTTSAEALKLVEAARIIVVELSGKAG